MGKADISIRTAEEALRALRRQADPVRAKATQRFFKTGKGEYGEGDRFLGVTMPRIRALVRELRGCPASVLTVLATSPWHEARMLSLCVLAEKSLRADEQTQEEIATMYLDLVKRGFVNNWDLVDVTAHKIVGPVALRRGPSLLARLARSRALWERRVSIIATFAHIRVHKLDVPLQIAELLLQDREDLIHKAVGWVLREVGKRDGKMLRQFLSTRYRTMPRTMLRYAIERFPKDEYRRYLNGTH